MTSLRRTQSLAVLALVGAGALAPACTESDAPPEQGPAPTTSYYRDAAPILAARCVTCHQASGIAPMALTTYEEASSNAEKIGVFVGTGEMPPFPPDTGACRPLEDPRQMPDAERELLLTWVDEGAPEGDPADAPADVPGDDDPDALGPPTDVFDSGLDYESDYPGDDEYRCFVIDPGLEERVDAVAFDVGSTNLAIVHHALLYAALPEVASAVDALDAADPRPGYECFGGPSFEPAIGVGAYVPGASAQALPAGTGIPLPAGTRFVVQIHYNFLNNRDPNRLSIEMWRATGPLTGVPHAARLGNRDFLIPAGAAGVTASGVTTIVAADQTPRGRDEAREGRAWTVGGHMHTLGRAIRVDLHRADGSDECLLDIPAWDFHWQGAYAFREPLDVLAGDRLEVTCTWDNTAEDQPEVDGERQQPRDVTWGEGTLDEMCLAGVILTDL